MLHQHMPRASRFKCLLILLISVLASAPLSAQLKFKTLTQNAIVDRLQQYAGPDTDREARLKRMFAARDDHILFFDAHDDAEYGYTVEVMDKAREGGAVTIATLSTGLTSAPGAAGESTIPVPPAGPAAAAPLLVAPPAPASP